MSHVKIPDSQTTRNQGLTLTKSTFKFQWVEARTLRFSFADNNGEKLIKKITNLIARIQTINSASNVSLLHREEGEIRI